MKYARAVSAVFALSLVATSPTSAALARNHAATIVLTQSGAVRGANEAGVLSWKGIPFAAPPVGPLRWRAPQPAASWKDVRPATAYASDCMQKPFGGDAAPLGTPPAEDCLYLNVWKVAGARPKLPVVLWIYGGGMVNGGSSPPTYSGAEMAKLGVMFVSFNYRVGRFGSFAHPALTLQEADKGLLADYAFLDQIAALDWVRRNIAAFGGDPANITIVGESAGGRSVHNLLTSPLSKGKFQRAVIMSGGGGAGGPTLAESEKIGTAFATSKGIPADAPQAAEKLRALSADQVTDGLNIASMMRGNTNFANPAIEGRIAVEPYAAYRTGAFNHVPLMVGATSEDIGGKTGVMVAGAHDVAATIAGTGVPVYEYRFSYVAESIGRGGAQHASDIPFFFDTAAIKYGDKTTPRDRAMASTISRYIANFARAGDPNGSGLPRWPRYDRMRDGIMDFATDGTAVPQKDPLGAEIEAALLKSPAPGY